ncbi:unnamed protein product [Prorocentrum cordatum]|uniref:Uncharacterized protein n=1 Tax=Prorocentrum cordatum TaxID=2364126 RepID=A0ABN9PS11_9DINO|nr:unnamed protein product [Polarella glacialis]
MALRIPVAALCCDSLSPQHGSGPRRLRIGSSGKERSPRNDSLGTFDDSDSSEDARQKSEDYGREIRDPAQANQRAKLFYCTTPDGDICPFLLDVGPLVGAAALDPTTQPLPGTEPGCQFRPRTSNASGHCVASDARFEYVSDDIDCYAVLGGFSVAQRGTEETQDGERRRLGKEAINVETIRPFGQSWAGFAVYVPGVSEHELIVRVLDDAVSFGQLNASELAIFQRLAHRSQLIEHTYCERVMARPGADNIFEDDY